MCREHRLIYQQLRTVHGHIAVNRIGVPTLGDSIARIDPLRHVYVHAVIGITRERQLMHAIACRYAQQIIQRQRDRVACTIACHVNLLQLTLMQHL